MSGVWGTLVCWQAAATAFTKSLIYSSNFNASSVKLLFIKLVSHFRYGYWMLQDVHNDHRWSCKFAVCWCYHDLFFLTTWPPLLYFGKLTLYPSTPSVVTATGLFAFSLKCNPAKQILNYPKNRSKSKFYSIMEQEDMFHLHGIYMASVVTVPLHVAYDNVSVLLLNCNF